ncbi:MAG TPA: hypothetical protein VFG44_09460 [Burkholderiales bacterium]|nr:hypothetical protein [Burkholderiales bacterium]
MAPAISSADLFVDVGAQTSRVEARIANVEGTVDTTETGAHIGVGVFRNVGERSKLGVRLELDNLGSNLLLAVRAVDWRYALSEHVSVGGFLGAARLDLATPAYGYYFGGGIQFTDVMPRWDIGIDLRYGDKIARDNVLPTDPQGGSPDNFYDLLGVSVYLSRRF